MNLLQKVQPKKVLERKDNAITVTTVLLSAYTPSFPIAISTGGAGCYQG